MATISYTDIDTVEQLERELRMRYNELLAVLANRKPRDEYDGAGKGRWAEPEQIRIFTHSPMERRLAVDGFNAILTEIKRLK